MLALFCQGSVAIVYSIHIPIFFVLSPPARSFIRNGEFCSPHIRSVKIPLSSPPPIHRPSNHASRVVVPLLSVTPLLPMTALREIPPMRLLVRYPDAPPLPYIASFLLILTPHPPPVPHSHYVHHSPGDLPLEIGHRRRCEQNAMPFLTRESRGSHMSGMCCEVSPSFCVKGPPNPPRSTV